MSLFNPTCPVDCASDIPVVHFNDCIPEIAEGEIQWIYAAAVDFPAMLVGDLAEWTAALSDTVADKIRTLHVMGSIAAPDSTETEITHGDKIWSTQTFTLEFDIVDLTDENYAFLRTLECNYKIRIWFATASHLYGGLEGIPVNMKVSNIIEKGIKSIGKFSGKAVWNNKFSPERAVNPLV